MFDFKWLFHIFEFFILEVEDISDAKKIDEKGEIRDTSSRYFTKYLISLYLNISVLGNRLKYHHHIYIDNCY